MSSSGGHGLPRTSREWILGLVLPILMIVVILLADRFEGPKTAYVGVLSVVPMFAAVFGTAASTALVGVITLASAYVFGLIASDGNVPAQTVRLIIIGMFVVIAVVAAFFRVRLQRQAEAADVDFLTGLLNRRGVFGKIEARSIHPMTVALIDVDGLKTVNDTHGHHVGDEFIQGVAGRIVGNVASTDIVGRWGGDEFVVVLELGTDDATAVLERVQQRVTASPIRTSVGDIVGHVSIGLTERASTESIDAALARADKALYAAKADMSAEVHRA